MFGFLSSRCTDHFLRRNYTVSMKQEQNGLQGHFRSFIGNLTRCEIKWSGGLTIVILTCAMVMPVYMPEHGGMSQGAQQSNMS